jgi:hypothetical protein
MLCSWRRVGPDVRQWAAELIRDVQNSERWRKTTRAKFHVPDVLPPPKGELVLPVLPPNMVLPVLLLAPNMLEPVFALEPKPVVAAN